MKIFNQKIDQKNPDKLYVDIKVPYREQPIISLCTLAALNLGKIKNLAQMRGPLHRIVEGLDTLLDYQDYPVEAARYGTMLYRPLGVGVINLAYYFAKHKVKYGDPQCLELTHQTFEAFQYYLLEGSMLLAKELGPCEGFKDTLYADGLLPIDTYSKAVDEIIKPNYLMPWDELREDIVKYGLRNCTVSAFMPAETSAWISNATNGIEAIKALLTIKGNKENVVPVLVPDVQKYKKYYQTVWDVETRDYLSVVSVAQKFTDQSFSANSSYNPQNYPENKIPLDVCIEDILTFAKNGGKTMYYANTFDGNQQESGATSSNENKDDVQNQESTNDSVYVDSSEDGCASGACAI